MLNHSVALAMQVEIEKDPSTSLKQSTASDQLQELSQLRQW